MTLDIDKQKCNPVCCSVFVLFVEFSDGLRDKAGVNIFMKIGNKIRRIEKTIDEDINNLEI